MIDAPYESQITCTPEPAQTDRTLQMRICAEYLEMPGMRLTLRQAARLFDLEPTQCARLLEALVADGFLWTNGREFFRRQRPPPIRVSRAFATD